MTPSDPVPLDPYVLVLGTAQDGGLPQIGCDAEPCRAARRDPARRRRVTSLLVVDPRDGRRFLLDASLDLDEQVEAFAGHPPSRALPGPRPPLVDAIFLTHAHMGHYTGLLFLGREAYGMRDVTVHATPRMAGFLADNAPWIQLFGEGALRLSELAPGATLALAPDLSITALAVPHRDELSDTVAFVVRGPSRALLYLPDVDAWELMDPSIEERLAEVDVALLDATFFDGDELPGRDLSKIPHPFVVQSLARFAALPAAERAKVRFTHLNHTNPIADPGSAAAARVRAAGMHVAREGEVFALGER